MFGVSCVFCFFIKDLKTFIQQSSDSKDNVSISNEFWYFELSIH